MGKLAKKILILRTVLNLLKNTEIQSEFRCFEIIFRFFYIRKSEIVDSQVINAFAPHSFNIANELSCQQTGFVVA